MKEANRRERAKLYRVTEVNLDNSHHSGELFSTEKQNLFTIFLTSFKGNVNYTEITL